MQIRAVKLVGIACAFLAVVFGAFGAHALKDSFNAYQKEVWQTAVNYQMWHALALLLLSRAQEHISKVAWFFSFGILLFSGSLYLLCLSGQTFFGAITPLGGICFLLGWLLWFGQTLKSS